MAFNPFDVFRRNQKILFACLTVLIMFMFTLQFGQGDFFSRVPRWLASGRKSGTVLAQVNGSKVYASELEQVRADRVLANQYMFAAASRGADALAAYIKEGASRASAENRPAFESILQIRESLPMMLAMAQDPRFSFRIEQMRQQRDQSYARIEAILAAKSPQAADLELAQTARVMTSLSDLVMASRKAHYFINQPNDGNRDLMDFLLWKKKADQLGIRLDDEAVKRLANDEFFGKLSNDDWRTAEDQVRNKLGYTADGLRRALGEEFRVRAAQAAVLGSQAVKPGGLVTDAPYDYYQFYRDQTNSARYGLVTVPVDNYVDKVQGQPTETELRDLFAKARTVEPDPRLPVVGLKEPRRIKLGFVEVSGSEPFYKAKAEAAVKAAEGATDLASPFAAATAAVSGPLALAGFEGPVKKQYALYRQEHGRQVTENWGTPTPFGRVRPLDTHVLETLNVAAAAAAFAAGGPPLTAPNVLVADGYASDRIAKIESTLPSLIVPVGPGVSGLASVLGSAGGYEAFLRPLPLAAVRGVMAERARELNAKQAAGEDMQTLTVDLAKPGTKPADAQARVEAFVKERGLTAGGSADLRDRFVLASDPGLKPLDAKFQSEVAARLTMTGGFVDPLQFSSQFFLEPDLTGSGQARPATGLYKPQVFPEAAMFRMPPDLPAFLVWRTADVAAESPRTLDDPTKNVDGLTAKDKAILAWKRQKARELARKEADELAKRAGGFGPSSVEIEMKLRDEAAKLAGQFASPEAKAKVQYHEIDRVAPLVSDPSFMAGRGAVSLFHIGRSSFIPYPPTNQSMEAALLVNREKAPATAVVLSDNPGDRLYVAVLVQKTENSADLFGLTIYGPTAMLPGNELAQAVRLRHQELVRQQIRDRAVSLLKAEFRYDKESDEVSKRADLFGD